MKKLVQNPLPTTQLLPLTWLCIRKTVEYDLVPPTQDLVEMKKKYLKNEEKRRIYTSGSIVRIISKALRDTNMSISKERAQLLFVNKPLLTTVF